MTTLNIDCSGVKQNSFCFRPNNEQDPFTGKLTVPTFALGFLMSTSLGVTEITEENVADVWTRLHIWQRTMGSIGAAEPLTYEDVRKHVGLKSGVSSLSDTKFRNRVFELLSDEAASSVTPVETPAPKK